MRILHSRFPKEKKAEILVTGTEVLGYTQMPVPATTPALRRCADLKRCSHNG